MGGCGYNGTRSGVAGMSVHNGFKLFWYVYMWAGFVPAQFFSMTSISKHCGQGPMGGSYLLTLKQLPRYVPWGTGKKKG